MATTHASTTTDGISKNFTVPGLDSTMRSLARLVATILLLLGLCALPPDLLADESRGIATTTHENEPEEAPADDKAATGKGSKDGLGITLESSDQRFAINAWLRSQIRYSDPFTSDPRSLEQFDRPSDSELEIRRVRLKLRGHIFNPKIGYYFEHELSGDRPLLDLRLDVSLRDDIQMRIGQYKVLYNRERVDSSGHQQFVERSISTYAFTLDRQVGATVTKSWAAGTRFDNRLMLGLFEGGGRDGGPTGDDPMLVGRWQWQFLGRDLPFSQSDLLFRDAPAATLAFGASRVRGPYTRFSISGGGQIEGFEAGSDNRYTLRQWLQESAWHYKGMSIQQEFHIKEITDHDESTDSMLTGGYIQFGKAWPVVWGKRNAAWELAIRFARVDWDVPTLDQTQDEVALATNLFLAGHSNKLSADVSRISLAGDSGSRKSEMRLRLQWDFSF
mgnify:CR=1 FL=1